MEILLFLLKRTCNYCYFEKSNVGITMVFIMAVNAMNTNLKTNSNNNSIFVNCGDYVFLAKSPLIGGQLTYFFL